MCTTCPDVRIKYLKFVEEKPLKFSFIVTSILCAMSTAGLLLERGETCQPDLRLWLSVVIVRSVIRLGCRLHYEYRVNMADPRIILGGDVHMSAKCVDILDVFGIVWFAVGNLLVFNNFACVGVSPIVFFSSLSYVCFSYVSFFLPPLLKCSLELCHPTRPDDLAYLQALTAGMRHPDRQGIAMVGLRRHREGPDAAANPDLTRERASYWSDWLDTHGCYAVSYQPGMDLKSGRNEMRIESGGAGTGAGMGGDLGLDVEEEIFCAVCLLPFECKGRPRTASASRSRTASFSPSFTRSRAPSGSASASAPRSRSASAALDAAAPPAPFSASTPPSFSISAFFSSSPSISFDASAPRSRSASASAAGGEAREGVVPQGDIEGGFNGLNPTDGPGGPGSRQGSGSTLPPNPNENDEPVEDNNVIVRYPCHGRHYFHAHCLHSWLQVSGARYLENYNQRTMRGQNLPLNVDHREHVTCPVCREHPQNAL